MLETTRHILMLSLFNPNYFLNKIMMNQSHKQMNKPKSKDIEKHKLPHECHLSAKNIITLTTYFHFINHLCLQLRWASKTTYFIKFFLNMSAWLDSTIPSVFVKERKVFHDFWNDYILNQIQRERERERERESN